MTEKYFYLSTYFKGSDAKLSVCNDEKELKLLIIKEFETYSLYDYDSEYFEEKKNEYIDNLKKLDLNSLFKKLVKFTNQYKIKIIKGVDILSYKFEIKMD
jgi:hypothetical protein